MTTHPSRQIMEDMENLNKLFIEKNSKGIRTALTENGKLVSVFIDPADGESWVGRVIVGQIKTILPNGFAFVDIGADKNAFMNLRRGHGLKAGQPVLVQVEKDAYGQKGMFVSQEVKLKGRFVVLFRDQKKMLGISKKLEESERTSIKKIAKSLLPEGFGAIVRTSCQGKDPGVLASELNDEIKKLSTALNRIENRARHTVPKTVLHPVSKSGLSYVLNEVMAQNIDEIHVSGKPGFFAEVAEDIKNDFPEYAGVVLHYSENSDLPSIFDVNHVSRQLIDATKKQVELPCGGSITIEETEACVVIDVNTGSNVGDKNYEGTILTTNLEAAKELAYQVRLRNLSGVIIVDFINLASKPDRESVLAALRHEFKNDRTPIDNLSETGLGGLVQFTRRKTRPPLSFYMGQPLLTPKFCEASARSASDKSVFHQISKEN